MRLSLIPLLACPDCRTDVTLSDEEEGTDAIVTEGSLSCSGCGTVFPITRGIPRMLPLSLRENTPATAAHFTNEFTAFSENDRDIDDPDLVEYYFFSRSGIDPKLYEKLPGDPCRTTLPGNHYKPNSEYLQHKIVLDAGCGPGRFLPVVADACEFVVGLDLGSHIDRAASRCTDRTNVEFVQGSVLDPPFKKATFDYVFSIGVVHHTPSARDAVHGLGELVKPHGGLSVWVYGPDYWNGRIRGPIARTAHRILSRLSPNKGLWACGHLLYRLGLVQMFLAKRPWTKLLGAPVFLLPVPRHPKKEVMITTIYDYYCAPLISTHTYEEVRGWMLKAGFTRLFRVPVPTAWFGERD
jgi:uncharacterized protein YbaR (Trm112 family)/SAM-dependent methyltransferase